MADTIRCPICRESVDPRKISLVGHANRTAFAVHPTRRATLPIDNLRMCWRVGKEQFIFNINAFEAFSMGHILLRKAVQDETFFKFWEQRGRTLGASAQRKR